MVEVRNQLLEAQRLEQRTHFDLEMLRSSATARELKTIPPPDRRRPGNRPYPAGLLSRNHLLMIDESHVTLPS